MFVFFFFNDTATTEIYTLSLHDALPILDTPMVIEVSLHYLHLLTGSILGILLHLCVESGVDFQTCSIQVDAIIVAPDRKSTRLNSSHANISYAVFCLKKKKI